MSQFGDDVSNDPMGLRRRSLISASLVGVASAALVAVTADPAMAATADPHVVDVRDYGAVGDGTTDDTSAIVAAQAALGSDPGIIHFPPGTYLTSTAVVLNTGQWLTGAGYEATRLVLLPGSSSNVVETADFSTLTGSNRADSPYNLGILDISVDGNRAQQTVGGKGVAIYAYGYTLRNVRIRGATREGIWSEWSAQSVSPGHDSMEAIISDFKVLNCGGDGIHFEGPHDSQIGRGIIAANGNGAGSYALNLPRDGVANGSNFTQIHIWGGTYQYGIRCKSSGVRFDNFVVEGGQTAQVWIDAAQVQFLGHLYTGTINTSTARGFILGSSGNVINATFIRARVENCGGGAVDLTYAGDHNDVEIQHFYYAQQVPALTTLGFVGTPTPRNRVQILVSDRSFVPTTQCLNQQVGPSKIFRTLASDTRDLIDLRDQAGSQLYRVDYRGRPRVAGPLPAVAAGGGAGSGAKVSVSGGDHAGTVTVTTGTTPAAGTLASITFSAVYGAAPHVCLTPRDGGGAALQIFVATAASAFSVKCNGVPSPDATYQFDYVVVG